MTPRLIFATIILACSANHQSADASKAEPIAKSSVELISLIEHASGTSPDLAYRVNMHLRREFTTTDQPELRDALLGWVQRSSGMTLTLTLDCWNLVRVRTKSSLTKADVEMLVGMLRNSSYASKAAHKWANETGKTWPCRLRLNSPSSILQAVEPRYFDRLINEISSPEPNARATFIRILASIRQGELSIDQEIQLYKPFQDPVPEVRQAVAFSLGALKQVPERKLKDIYMSLLNDPNPRVCSTAVNSIFQHPRIFNASDAGQIMNLATRLEGSELGTLMYALGSLTSTESPTVCDELIKTGIQLFDEGSVPDKRRINELLGKAARFATQEQVNRVAARLCLEYQSPATDQLPNTSALIMMSGHRFSTEHQIHLVQRSLQVLRVKEITNQYFRRRIGDATSLLINCLAPHQQQEFANELVQMLEHPATTEVSLHVLKKLGNAAHTSVPAITLLSQHHQDELRITATATLWTLTQDSDTCIPILLAGLQSTFSNATKTASDALIETREKLTHFKPQVTEVLHDNSEKTTLSMLRIIEMIGVDAKPLADAVEPLTKAESRKTKYYATRTLNAIAG